MDRTNEHAGLQAIMMDVARNAADLVQRELALFRGEIRHGLSGIMSAAVLGLLGFIFAIAGLALLAGALVEWLAVVMESRGLANLVVGVGGRLIAAVFFLMAKNRLSIGNVAPRRSLRSLERDRDVIARRAHG